MVGFERRHWMVTRQQLSRRRLLKGAGWSTATLAIAAAMACGSTKKNSNLAGNASTTGGSGSASGPSAAPNASATAAKQPKRGGTLTRVPGTGGGDVFLSGFDPHILNGYYTGPMGLFYQRLVRYRVKTYEMEPEIAQKWEQPSPTEYLFHIQPGVKWHNKPPVNGRDLTVNDVAFSLNRARSDDPKFIERSLLATVDKIEAADSTTLHLTTKGPNVALFSSLADLSLLILAPEVIDKYGNSKLPSADAVIGTGAFVLTAHDDSSGTLVRNPTYWRAGLPYLDGIKLIYIKDLQSQWSAFLSGQLDIGLVPGQAAKQFVAEQGKNFAVDYYKDVAAYNLWQNAARKPFDDPRVRRAMRLLLDHQEAISAWAEPWFGGGTLVSHLPGALNAWDYTQDEYRQMLEWKSPKDDAVKEALSLLNAAGFTKDKPLAFELQTSTGGYQQAGSELAQAQYKRLGQGVLQPTLKVLENIAQIDNMAHGNFEIGGPAVRGGYIDPDSALQEIYKTNGANNFGKWSDAQADQFIDKQRAIFDEAQRKTVVKDLLKYLIDNAPYVGYAARVGPRAAKPKVQGWVSEELREPYFQFEHVWLDV